MLDVVKPRALAPGDRVAVVAPASPFARDEFDAGLTELRELGFEPVYTDAVFITVVVEEKSPLVGTSRLMVMFSSKDMQLKQWTVTDPQGFDTTVAVYNLDTTRRADPDMFRIDYTKYRN